jgi:CDP-glucose 4,6-dehydratase
LHHPHHHAARALIRSTNEARVIPEPVAASLVTPERDFWRGRRVFITGHTGFKGGWLALWLASEGAHVSGYALAPSHPSLHHAIDLATLLTASVIGDIRDGAALEAAVQRAQPEVVFHLAAQPIVRTAYAHPLETLTVNAIGTATLLDALRRVDGVAAVVVVTSDKCYAPDEGRHRFGEDDRLGGFDPYASSKACAEIITAAYRTSFLASRGVAVATARAGNVIGGGDWSTDRLLPDAMRAAAAGVRLTVRHPHAIRPWQHVLEPVAGYLHLAEALLRRGAAYEGAWNFGPEAASERSVGWILDFLTARGALLGWSRTDGVHPHEDAILRIDDRKARERLGWRSRWSLEEALMATVAWFDGYARSDDMRASSLAQLRRYRAGKTPVAT